MRKWIYILGLVVFACNSENANDCFQTAGATIQQTVEVSSFERILVNRDIELIIKEAPNYAVTIETGANLLNDVAVEIIGDQLVLTDYNSCNFVRDYGITKIYVEAPNLKEIRSSTQYDISSDGVLNYENLSLLSEDYNGGSVFTIGDFRLQVVSEQLDIIANNLSFFYIQGTVTNLSVGFFAGSSRFEGEQLIAQHVSVSHRSSNDMRINPQATLTGQIRGTGDVISVNQPPVVDVAILYTGQLFFE